MLLHSHPLNDRPALLPTAAPASLVPDVLDHCARQGLPVQVTVATAWSEVCLCGVPRAGAGAPGTATWWFDEHRLQVDEACIQATTLRPATAWQGAALQALDARGHGLLTLQARPQASHAERCVWQQALWALAAERGGW